MTCLQRSCFAPASRVLLSVPFFMAEEVIRKFSRPVLFLVMISASPDCAVREERMSQEGLCERVKEERPQQLVARAC